MIFILLLLQIQMPAVLQIQLIYSVYLSSSTPAQGQPGWPKIGSSKTAIVDPHGLVEIAPTNLNVTVVEGSKVSFIKCFSCKCLLDSNDEMRFYQCHLSLFLGIVILVSS